MVASTPAAPAPVRSRAAPRISASLARASFEAHPDALYAVAADAKLLGANRAGLALLARGEPLRLLRGRLCAGASARALEQGIAEAARGERETSEIEVGAQAGGRLSLRLLPLDGAAGVLVVARERWETARLRPAARFGFTRAEWRVAERVARGMNVREIAQELGVAVDTVRCHLKQVFVKASVHRQAQLVARLLSR